jgi:hypothetical protein
VGTRVNNQDEELDVIDISWQLRTDYRDYTGTQGFNEFGDGVLAGDAGIFGGPAARQSSDFADGKGMQLPDGSKLIHCYHCGRSLLVEPNLKDMFKRGKILAQCNCGYKNRVYFRKSDIVVVGMRTTLKQIRNIIYDLKSRSRDRILYKKAFNEEYKLNTFIVRKWYYLYTALKERYSSYTMLKKGYSGAKQSGD